MSKLRIFTAIGATAFWIAFANAAINTAHAVELDGHFVQGGMVVGHTVPDAKVMLGDKPVRVDKDGLFVFGFGRDAKSKAELTVNLPDGKREVRKLVIRKRTYHVQRINGLPSKMVTPPPETLKRIIRENNMIKLARETDSGLTSFAGKFIWPARGQVTGVYGSQRILNGKPKRPHYGLDVAAPVGTPVIAPAAGTILMAEKDLYYTGGTVIIDHGHGVTSVLMHMSRVDVKKGQTVKQGEQVGAVGQTGRATGPHVDWRVNWFMERLDPQFLVHGKPQPLD